MEGCLKSLKKPYCHVTTALVIQDVKNSKKLYLFLVKLGDLLAGFGDGLLDLVDDGLGHIDDFLDGGGDELDDVVPERINIINKYLR